MENTMEEVLLAFSEKYQGDFLKVFQAIKTKERLTEKEVDYFIRDIDEQYITIMSEDYPDGFKKMSCPPIVLYYEGNLELINENFYELCSPIDEKKRVFFNLIPDGNEIDYFLGTENRGDFEILKEKFIDVHPEMNFKDYRKEESLCL